MGKSVLVINNKKEYQQYFQTKLKPNGFDVFIAFDDCQGLEKAQKYLPDCIVLDFQQTQKNDFHLLEGLNKNKEIANTPILFLTSNGNAALKNQFSENSAIDFLQMPIDEQQLQLYFNSIYNKDSMDNSYKNLNILVAEDDAVNRRMVEYLLKKNEYKNVRLAVDGEQALNLFLQEIPDLLILDYLMPKKTGFEVLQEIRKNSRFNNIPIIFLTAVDDKNKLINALNSGATDFITKPFDQTELIARIKAHARNYYLRKRLSQIIDKLRKKNEQIESDLENAKRIQEALLPKLLPEFENLKISYYYQASNLVGGDFLNIFQLDNTKVGFYIADVSGHGVTAALVTVFIREQLNNILKKLHKHQLTPGKVLQKLNINYNTETNFIDDGVYLTIFFGIIDLEKYTLIYSSAGHHAFPILIDQHRKVEELSQVDVAIGFLDDFPYHDYEIKLSKNLKIFLHTDGIIEEPNRNNELFGMDRLKKFLIDNYDLHQNELAKSVVKNVLQFSKEAEPRDDIALILLEIE